MTSLVIEVMKKGLDFIKRQKRPFKVNMIRASANTFLRQLTAQYRSVYILRLGATPLQLGLIDSIGGIVATAISPLTGWLADRCGIRKMFLISTPPMVLSSVLFALAFDWTWTVPAVFLGLLSLQILNTVCPMVCGNYLKNEERATGKQLCDTLSAIPGLIAPLFAATLVSRLGGLNAEGIRPLYVLQTFGFLVVLAFTYKFYFDILKEREVVHRNFFGGVRRVFKEGTAVKRWIMYRFLSSATMYLGATYLSVFVAEVKHGDEFVVGMMTTASFILPLTLSLFLGRLADTLGRKKVLYVTIPLYCASILILVYANNTIMILISAVLQGFLLLSAVTEGAITAELMPISLLGKWYGILNLFRGLAGIAVPVIGGIMWVTIGPSYIFLLMIGTEICKLIMLWLTIPETLSRSIAS